MSKKTKGFHPYAAVTIGIIGASSSSILIRFAQENAPSLVIAAYRMLISSAILWLYILLTRDSTVRSTDRHSIRMGILSGFFLSVHFATWITSLEYTTITSSVVLVTTSPLFVAALSPILLKEKIRSWTILGLFFAFSGAALIAAADSRVSLATLQSLNPANLTRRAVTGDFLALAGAAAGAGYILIGRDLRKRISLLPYITISYSSAAVILLGMALLFHQPIMAYPPETFLWFLLLALIPQLIAHSSMNWALRFLPAAFVSISLLGEPIGTSILAYIIFQELPARLTLVGASLIFLGIVFASRSTSGAGQKVSS
ncbi:MAG: DMT family transporter [Anaerolineales bacterium]|nr:DMT family transporter [Anaerolineales bacterium]